MIYGYCRCSTNEKKQDIDGQKGVLKELGVKNSNIFWEYESGAKDDRQELNRLLAIVKTGDTIVTTEVSRFTRSTKHLCEIIELVKEKRIKLVIGSFIVDCTQDTLDPMTEGMLKMWGVFAEMERKMTCQRIKYGMDNARAKGKQIGRKKTTADDIPPIFYKHYPKYKSGDINKKEFSRICDLSYPTIYKYLAIVENS